MIIVHPHLIFCILCFIILLKNDTTSKTTQPVSLVVSLDSFEKVNLVLVWSTSTSIKIYSRFRKLFERNAIVAHCYFFLFYSLLFRAFTSTFSRGRDIEEKAMRVLQSASVCQLGGVSRWTIDLTNFYFRLWIHSDCRLPGEGNATRISVLVKFFVPQPLGTNFDIIATIDRCNWKTYPHCTIQELILFFRSEVFKCNTYKSSRTYNCLRNGSLPIKIWSIVQKLLL